jgi:hypothetical protein
MKSPLLSGKILPWMAAMALCATAALAQGAPPSPPPNGGPDGPHKAFNDADIAKMHARICLDLYAQEAGHLTVLETRLQLNDKQKSAFEKWKAVKMTAAKALADACAAMAPPPKDGAKPKAPSPVDALKSEMQHLKARVAELKAEEPALEALVGALSEEQLQAFAPPHGGPHWAGRKGPHEDPTDGPKDGHGPGDAPPPPPDRD